MTKLPVSSALVMGALTPMVSAPDIAICGGLSPSCTSTVKVELPCVVGVPEMAPVEEFRLSPGGSEPEATLQLLLPSPPLACSTALYGKLTLPAGRCAFTTVSVESVTSMLSAPLAVAGGVSPSVTLTVKLNIPSCVGVPVMAHDELCR